MVDTPKVCDYTYELDKSILRIKTSPMPQDLSCEDMMAGPELTWIREGAETAVVRVDGALISEIRLDLRQDAKDKHDVSECNADLQKARKAAAKSEQKLKEAEATISLYLRDQQIGTAEFEKLQMKISASLQVKDSRAQHAKIESLEHELSLLENLYRASDRRIERLQKEESILLSKLSSSEDSEPKP